MPALLSVDQRQRILTTCDAKEELQRQLDRTLQGELVIHPRSEAT
jgi:hypothetical protein